jgi:hypothetical protein
MSRARGALPARLTAVLAAGVLSVSALAGLGLVAAQPAAAQRAGATSHGVRATPRVSKANPVLFVHGYNPTSTSTDCSSTFNQMIVQMQSQGFTGQMVRVGFYSGDTNCNVNLHSWGSYGDRDSWKSIAAAFSWYVYDNFTQYGVPVDVVGYSMGGLIVRGAVYGSQVGASGFSPRINVSDGVTLGGPHNGAAWYSNLCLWGQCSSLAPGSTDLNWLNQNGNPQGTAGTTWTNIGSYNDDVVPWQSATYMSIAVNRKVVFSNISHTGLIHPWYGASWDVINEAANALGVTPGKITSGVSSGLCVDARSSGTSDGTAVQIYTCNGSGAQVWFHSVSGKTLLTADGKCLDISNSSSSAGTKVQLWDCNTGSNQEWTIGSDHSLQALGMCLDDPGSTTAAGTQLQIWSCNGTSAQKWYFG